MNVTTHRIKQYNSTYKTVVCVDGKPICIVAGVGKTLSNVIAYLNGYDADIADAKVKKALDVAKAESENKSICDSCVAKRCEFQSCITVKHCDFYKSGR